MAEISKASRQQMTQKKRVSHGASLHEHHQVRGTGHSPASWLATKETWEPQRVVRNKHVCPRAALAAADRDVLPP